MKKLTHLDQRMMPISEMSPSPQAMPTALELLQLAGNVKAKNADDARRTRRLLVMIRLKEAKELVLHADDHAFLIKVFEENQMGLTSWFQGQILDILESAENWTPELAKV